MCERPNLRPVGFRLYAFQGARRCFVAYMRWGTRVYTLGVPGYILRRYPGVYSGRTRVYTLGVPGYILLGTYALRVPGYILWGYPVIYFEGPRVNTLGGTEYILWGYPGTYRNNQVWYLGIYRRVLIPSAEYPLIPNHP